MAATDIAVIRVHFLRDSAGGLNFWGCPVQQSPSQRLQESFAVLSRTVGFKKLVLFGGSKSRSRQRFNACKNLGRL